VFLDPAASRSDGRTQIDGSLLDGQKLWNYCGKDLDLWGFSSGLQILLLWPRHNTPTLVLSWRLSAEVTGFV
jgi:hypothetical protein